MFVLTYIQFYGNLVTIASQNLILNHFIYDRNNTLPL